MATEAKDKPSGAGKKASAPPVEKKCRVCSKAITGLAYPAKPGICCGGCFRQVFKEQFKEKMKQINADATGRAAEEQDRQRELQQERDSKQASVDDAMQDLRVCAIYGNKNDLFQLNQAVGVFNAVLLEGDHIESVRDHIHEIRELLDHIATWYQCSCSCEDGECHDCDCVIETVALSKPCSSKCKCGGRCARNRDEHAIDLGEEDPRKADIAWDLPLAKPLPPALAQTKTGFV